MSNEQKSDTEQHQFWQMVLETFKSSGLSVRKFCKQEGMSGPAFYFWRKKLTETNEPKAANPPAFIKISMPKDNPAPLELVLSSGNTLRVNFCTDSKTLSNIISILRREGLC